MNIGDIVIVNSKNWFEAGDGHLYDGVYGRLESIRGKTVKVSGHTIFDAISMHPAKEPPKDVITTWSYAVGKTADLYTRPSGIYNAIKEPVAKKVLEIVR